MLEHSRSPWTGLRSAVRATERLDRVEVKILVPDDGYELLLAELRGLVTSTRRVYYLDTPGLDLACQGIVIRARTARRGRADSVVKLRRDRPARLPRGVRHSSHLSVELDALPAESWWTTAVTRRVPRSVVHDAVRGREPLRSLMSGEQRRFLRALTSQRWRDLRVHGPARVTRNVGEIPGSGLRLDLQSWDLPGRSRLTEVSTKCPPARGPVVATALRHLLAERGIDLDVEQVTKAGASLTHFTG